MGNAGHIGRIGTLAAALGIGMAIAASPGQAFADPTDPSGPADSSTTAPADSTGVQGSSPSRAARTALRRRATSPSPSSALPAAATGHTPQHNSPAPTVHPTAATATNGGVDPTPADPTNRAATVVTTTGQPTGPTTPSPDPTPLTTTAPLVTALTSAPAPRPTATVASRRALASGVTLAGSAAAVVDTLLGGNPLTDAQSPLMWASLAVARRHTLRAAAPTVTASSTTSSLVLSPTNLLVNPGAELGDPSLSGFSSVSIPGWTAAGTPTVIKYGTPRNLWPMGLSFPTPNLPSFLGFPKTCNGTDGGNQFFGGGNVATSSLTQTVDLSAAATGIDAGTVTFNLSGYLGGFLIDPSAASLKVTFLDKNKTYLGSASTGPVTVLDRWLQTGFQQRQTSGALPEGTRYAQVELDLQDCNPRILGFRARYNNAYADNLSFTISDPSVTPAVPAPTPDNAVKLDHVFMVYMENKGYNDIVGSPNAPFLNSLINNYGFADNYYGLTHPSLPNYYPIVGGTDFGKTYNCAGPCIDTTNTLVAKIDTAGKVWRSYAQGLTPGADPLQSSGDYAVDETPFPAFTSIANSPLYAAQHIVPLEQMAIDLQSKDTAPNFAWFAADENSNGEGPVGFPWGALKFVFNQIDPKHQYNVPALDKFLSQTVPTIMNSEAWKSTDKSVIVVTFDEDNNNTSLGFGNEGNHIVTVVIPNKAAVDAGMKGGHFVATDHLNHYSLLRMIEDTLGLTPLTNNDAYAAPMNEFFTGKPDNVLV